MIFGIVGKRTQDKNCQTLGTKSHLARTQHLDLECLLGFILVMTVAWGEDHLVQGLALSLKLR